MKLIDLIAMALKEGVDPESWVDLDTGEQINGYLSWLDEDNGPRFSLTGEWDVAERKEARRKKAAKK